MHTFMKLLFSFAPRSKAGDENSLERTIRPILLPQHGKGIEQVSVLVAGANNNCAVCIDQHWQISLEHLVVHTDIIAEMAG